MDKGKYFGLAFVLFLIILFLCAPFLSAQDGVIVHALETEELSGGHWKEKEGRTYEINGSQYTMKKNTSDIWIYKCPWVNFGEYIEFKIANASDAHGNWITTKIIKSIKLNKDIIPPDILQWEYYHETNSFKICG